MPNSFNWTPVIIACLIVSVGQLGIGLLLPALPAISHDLVISNAQAQWYISIYLLGFGGSQLIYGPLSDAWGRRPVLIAGLSIALFGALVCFAGQSSADILLLGRLLQGIGAGSTSVMARTMMRDSYEGKQLTMAMSYVGITVSFTPMVAPVLGGYISFHLGWLSLFLTMAGYIALIWLMMFLKFEETRIGEKHKVQLTRVLAGYKALIGDKYFLGYAGLNWILFSLSLLVISVMPYLIQKGIGLDANTYGRWALVPAVFVMLGSLISNSLRHRLNNPQRLQLCYLILASSALLFVIAPLDVYWLIASQSVLAFSFGIGFPVSLSCLLAPYKNNSGAVSALAGSIQMLIASLGAALLIKLGVTSPQKLGYTLMIGTLICLLLHKVAQQAVQSNGRRSVTTEKAREELITPEIN